MFRLMRAGLAGTVPPNWSGGGAIAETSIPPCTAPPAWMALAVMGVACKVPEPPLSMAPPRPITVGAAPI